MGRHRAQGRRQARLTRGLLGGLLAALSVAAHGPAGAQLAACAAATGGQSALQSAASALAPGQACRFNMNGPSWQLLQAPPRADENHFEFGANGVYDAIRKKIRYFGGPHTGDMQCLEYDEASNQWSRCTNPPNAGGGHGYDHNVVDPKTGHHYVRLYNSARFFYWNGATWTRIADNNCDRSTNEPAIGVAWDEDRNGIITFSDNAGVCFWSKADDRWTHIGEPKGILRSYHFLAEYNPRTKLMWLQDGNGSTKHWSLDASGRINEQKPAPIPLGCCGKGGVMSAYDHASGKFVVADPFNNALYEYDIAADSWRKLALSIPLDQTTYDASNVEGIVVPVAAYGVIVYVMARGKDRPAQAFLYKHAK
jgi:hypothetical protein